MARVRRVPTASGVTAIQIVWGKHKGALDVEHVGSAHNPLEAEILTRQAWDRINAGQDTLDRADETPSVVSLDGFRIVSSSSVRLWESLQAAWRACGFDSGRWRDDVFQKIVLTRCVEPTSKRDTIRVLGELGVRAPGYQTILDSLDRAQARDYRKHFEKACAAHVDIFALRLCLYDVTTLYWETDQADEFRIPGYSKERRLEPQILVGLLVTPSGCPLMVRTFEGNKAETQTIVPVLEEFKTTNALPTITVVADAGMMSQKNLAALEDAGYGFIIAGRIPRLPPVVDLWFHAHPGQVLADKQIFTTTHQGTKSHPRAWTEYFQYRADWARKNEHGIDKSVARAESLIATGPAATSKNKFITHTGGTLQLNEDLIASARQRAGIRSYMTNLTDPDPAFIIHTYHRLYNVEKSFRISKHDLAARPAYHWRRDRIETHITIVFAALAISRWIEATTSMSIKAFINATRPIRQVTLDINGNLATSENDIPPTIQTALTTIQKHAGD